MAVGNNKFVDSVRERLGFRAKGRSVVKGDAGFELRESGVPYNNLFKGEKADLRSSNAYIWDV